MNTRDKVGIFAVGLLAASIVSTQVATFYLIHQVTKPNAEEIICPNIQVTLNGEDITEHGVLPDEPITQN